MIAVPDADDVADRSRGRSRRSNSRDHRRRETRAETSETAVEDEPGHFPVTGHRVLAGRRFGHAAERADAAPAASPPMPTTRAQPERAQRRHLRAATRRAMLPSGVAALVAVRGRIGQLAGADRVHDDRENDTGDGHASRSNRRRPAGLRSRERSLRTALGCIAVVSPGPSSQRTSRLFAEPDQLPPRVAHVLLHDERARRGLVAHAAQHLDDLTVDEPAERVRRLAARRRASSAATSSTTPRANCCVDPARDARRADRAAARSGRSSGRRSPAIGDTVCVEVAVSGRPVSR